MVNRKPKSKPVPIRMDALLRSRLDLAAQRLCSNRACVIRLAVAQLLPMVEEGNLQLH